MNTLLDLMQQVWNRRTPARPSAAASSAPSGDLWQWYCSRCVEEEKRKEKFYYKNNYKFKTKSFF